MGIYVTFWGVRGSIPTPGNATQRYGGNTACIEVLIQDQLFILDGGSGFGKCDSLTEEEQLSSKVMIGIGGGHYAPRHSDVIRKTD